MDALLIKPRRDEAALEAEQAHGMPEPPLEAVRRLLHVATGILVLLSAYTFYIAAPVLIPLTISVLITMLLAPVMNLFDGLKMPHAAPA